MLQVLKMLVNTVRLQQSSRAYYRLVDETIKRLITKFLRLLELLSLNFKIKFEIKFDHKMCLGAFCLLWDCDAVNKLRWTRGADVGYHLLPVILNTYSFPSSHVRQSKRNTHTHMHTIGKFRHCTRQPTSTHPGSNPFPPHLRSHVRTTATAGERVLCRQILHKSGPFGPLAQVASVLNNSFRRLSPSPSLSLSPASTPRRKGSPGSGGCS